MEEQVDKLIGYVTTYGLSILAAAAIFIIGKWVARAIANGMEKLMKKQNVDPALTGFSKNLVYFGLLAFVVIAAVGKLGVQTTSFVAVIGAAGLAVGLALQGSLANFAAGVMIIVFKPFKVGDFVNANGIAGSVQEIQIFNTIMNTPDNVRIIIPNAQVTSGSITNYAANPTRRVDLKFGISYGDDIAKARDILKQVLAAESRVLPEPVPVIAVSELGDSSVNFVCRPWCKREDYWGVFFDLTEKVKIAFDKNGISIPFPQRDVHHYNVSDLINK